LVYKNNDESSGLMATRIFKQTLKEGEFRFGKAFPVPIHIPRPPPTSRTDFCQKVNATDIPQLRESARIASSALLLSRTLAKPGITTEFIDNEVSRYIVSRSAYPSGIGFMGFPKSICTAVNEVVAHGIPDQRPLMDGDIVNFDITCFKNGFYGDNSEMALVGKVDDAGKRLVETTREALRAAISVCQPGRKFSVIAQAIEQVASSQSYAVVDYFCGHFIGRQMHIAPNIHHTRGNELMDRLVMEEGMVFTIEPILVEGSTEAEIWKDGWTYVTKDRGRTAQCEHMVLITSNGNEVLTIADDSF
jgi:methionyl aminopeptidase